MCGIIGMWGQSDKTLLLHMLDRIEHRGPDGRGVHVDATGDSGLAHCRLAIMDPQDGAQPLYNEDRSATLVANSEIYNFHALREQLDATHGFQTDSDSEAILHLLEDQDSTAVAALDGMFAFAMQAGPNLYLARDPVGIKPLYYGKATVQDEAGQDTSTLYFASEQKALAGVVDTITEFPPGAYYDSQRGLCPILHRAGADAADRAVGPTLARGALGGGVGGGQTADERCAGGRISLRRAGQQLDRGHHPSACGRTAYLCRRASRAHRIFRRRAWWPTTSARSTMSMSITPRRGDRTPAAGHGLLSGVV